MRSVSSILVFCLFIAACDRKAPVEEVLSSQRAEELSTHFAAADRILIQKPREQVVWHTIDGHDKVTELLSMIKINDSQSGFHCMCDGDFLMTLYQGKISMGTVGYHHNRSLRWHSGQWDEDSLLTQESSSDLIEWFEKNGFDYPADTRRAKEKEAATKKTNHQRFVACFNEGAHQHFDYSRSADTDHEDVIKQQAERLIAAYESHLDLGKDIFRAFSTRPAPWLTYRIADQIAEEALTMLPENSRLKLLNAAPDLSPAESTGACFLMVRHDIFKPPFSSAQQQHLLTLLKKSLQHPADNYHLSQSFLWFARHKITGVADLLRPYVFGEHEFMIIGPTSDYPQNPSPVATAALALSLLDDQSIREKVALYLKENTKPTPDHTAYTVALAHLKKDSKLVTVDDFHWNTYLLHDAMFALAEVDPCIHSYSLVIDGGSAHSWAMVNEEAVITFQSLTGQKWYQNHKNERASWHAKTAQKWWKQNKDTFTFPDPD
ncbi:hypothetical protein [Oceaniferula spumae]